MSGASVRISHQSEVTPSRPLTFSPGRTTVPAYESTGYRANLQV